MALNRIESDEIKNESLIESTKLCLREKKERIEQNLANSKSLTELKRRTRRYFSYINLYD